MKLTEYGKENKDVIMLLHGGGLSSWNYRKEVELLKDRFHVILPVLDGHAQSDDDFTSIEDNAERLIRYMDADHNGHVLLLGGLSLGAQILTEILSRRSDICRYAVIESPSLIPSKATNALIGPSVSSSYGLIGKEWFARLQFKSLHIDEDYYEEYFRDSKAISKENMIAFLKANTGYSLKESIRENKAKTRIIIGSKEPKLIHDSAKLLHKYLNGSTLEIREGYYHGDYSLNHPKEYVSDLLRMIEE